MPRNRVVREVMMPNFKKIDSMFKVSEALKMLKREKINAVLIEPRDEMDVYGIMTLKDIARKVIAERRKLHEAHVYEIMSKPVFSVQADMPLPYAARLMTNFNISYAMVVDNNEIIGLVSLNGIVTTWDME
ncbi:MAG: CBS domain-containing protein [Nitrospinae bacterium CG11_big_fil_rev_8_21_14_0_20_45_15]|nr:MAG: CBS domain-containing protein [Nitrospinae bacterium CG11_big_fil_rev_8_21_14_0_20_45_15]